MLKRREIEFTVGNFESAIQFLEALGFEPAAYYEKYRETHELNGAHVMLDELPFGSFCGDRRGRHRYAAQQCGGARLALGRSRQNGVSHPSSVVEKHSLDAGQLKFQCGQARSDRRK